MKKKVCLKLLVLTALGSVAFTGVDAGVLSAKEDEAPIAAKAEDLAFFEWKGKFAGGWNPNPDAMKSDLCSYIIALNGTGFPKVNGSNLRDVAESGGQVTINGVALNALEEKHNVAFDHSQNNQYVLLRFRKEQVVALEGKDYCEVHINEGTVFDGYKLRELTIHINPSTYVATIVPSKKHNTNVVGIKPYEYSAGWFRIDLEGYPTQKKDDTVTVYNYLNFANKIYVNGDPNNTLLTPNKETYSMTFNVAGCNGLSFNASNLKVPVADINSVTIPAGTEFPGKAGDGSADYENYYVTQKDQTFVRYGNDFFEEVPTNVTDYYPSVWGGGQRGFKLEGFTDDSGDGGDKSGQPFNFITNIYINKDKNQLLSKYSNRAALYYKIGHSNTFGTLLCKDFTSSQEQYVTIPAGTQFPDSKAWKGQIGGKVFVTQDEVTFGKQYSGKHGDASEFSGYKFKKTTEIKESVNYGLTSFEGFKGSTEDYISGGAGMTNFPLNNFSPFGNTNVDFKFRINNSVGNNFDGSFFISSTGVCDGSKGGYVFRFAKTYLELFYNNVQIGSTVYHTPDLPQFLDGEDIDIEICAIKTDETHVRLAFLMNGVALIDTVRDCSTDVLGNINSAKMYTTTDNPMIFKNVDVDDEALDRFLTKGLKMDDKTATFENYPNAKDYFDNNLTPTQKALFNSSDKYAAARTRFSTWAEEFKPVTFKGIETLQQAEVRVFDNEPRSLKFTTRLDAAEFDELASKIVKIGTYIVVADAYKASSYPTVGEYIANTEKGSKTYADIPNTNMDFVNESTAKTDGYYEYCGTLANIKDGNIAKEFIPVGYVQVKDKVFFGQDGEYSTSLYAELLKIKDSSQDAQKILDKVSNALALKTIEGTYGLNFVAGKEIASLTPSSNGAYALTPTRDISALFIDGKRYSVSISANSTKYLLNEFGKITFSDVADTLKRGFAEPTHELWTSDTNQASYNTSDNNAALCELTGAKSMRIWVAISNLVEENNNWPGIGLVTVNRQQGWNFDTNYVNQIKTAINKYKNAGVEEITLLVNGFAFDEYSKIFPYNDGTGNVLRRAFNNGGQDTSITYWPFSNTFPDKYDTNSALTFEYEDFISLNADLYEKIGDAFDGYVTSVESMNEINLRAMDFDYRYCDDNYVETLNSNGKIMDDQDFLAEMSMDYCKAMTDGIKASGADIRVLSPAISPVGDTVGNVKRDVWKDYPTVENVTRNQNGLRYLEECMKYIQSKGGKFNDYFQGLNIHPYLFDRRASAGTIDGAPNEAYLYINAPKGKVGFENQVADVDYNSNYAEDWANELDKYHNMLEDYGDYNVPFYLTEYGLCDKARIDSNHWGLWNSTGFIRTVMRNIDAEICSRSWIKAYYWYRMYDYNNNDGTPGEADYGIVDTDGNLKFSGQELYYLNNGSEYQGAGPVVDVGGGN